MITNNLKTIMRYKMSSLGAGMRTPKELYDNNFGVLTNTCGEYFHETINVTQNGYWYLTQNVSNLSREDDLELDADSPEVAIAVTGTTIAQQVGTFILVGSGNTEPSSSDYRLDNCVSCLTDCGQYVVHGNGNLFSVNRILRNDTNENVVINEVGLYNRPFYIVNPSNSCRTKLLLVREVLPETVTLHPGDSYTFTISLTI